MGDLDCDFHKKKPMVTLLDNRVKLNRVKQGNNFHEQWEHFSPFVLYVDGMLGKESLVILTNLIQPIFHLQGLVNGCI